MIWQIKKGKPKAKMTPLQEIRFLKIVILLVVLAFLWLLLAPGTGFLSLLRQRSELKTLQQQTQVLAEQNEIMRAEIENIEGDAAYLEEIARRDYGLVKDNEILFEFPSKKKGRKAEK